MNADRCCRCADPAVAVAQITTPTGRAVEHVCAAHVEVLERAAAIRPDATVIVVR